MARCLKCAHEHPFLLRRDAAEHGVFPHGFGKITLRAQTGGVDVAVGVLNAGAGRDLGDRNGVITGDNADGNALLRKIAEGGLRIRAQQV